MSFNAGYIPETEVVTIGLSEYYVPGFEFDVLFADSESDEASGLGLRAGYMLKLVGDNAFDFYIAPRLGWRFLTYSDGSDREENGLLYEAAAGIYLYPLNLSVGIGQDDVAETGYTSFRIGIAF
jgi:hypothetical protein